MRLLLDEWVIKADCYHIICRMSSKISMCKCHKFYERTSVHQLNLQGFHISIEFKVITIPVSFSSAGNTGDLVLTSCVIQNIKPQILWGEDGIH